MYRYLYAVYYTAFSLWFLCGILVSSSFAAKEIICSSHEHVSDDYKFSYQQYDRFIKKQKTKNAIV